MTAEPSTPLMRQYHSIKQQVPNALLLFRLGDFYELFYEDAIIAARELEITLTSRNKEKGEPIPMCGVPYHSAETYIARLIQKGYRVAIGEQVEDPRFAKHLVRREITRIVTPGTATESGVLRARENNYLAAVKADAHRVGVALADVSTGEFRVMEVAPEEVAPLLEQMNARELLLAANEKFRPSFSSLPLLYTELDAWVFSSDYAERTLREHFRLLTLEGCGLAGKPAAIAAAGAIIHYLKDTQKAALTHLELPAWIDRSHSLVLDAVTVRNLELVEPLFSADLGGGKESTLLSVIDRTATAMGARLLRQRLLSPSTDPGEIEARLDAVAELRHDTIRREQLRERLARILDLERLLAKVTLSSASPRDLLALGRSLSIVPELLTLLACARSARLAQIREQLDPIEDVRDAILSAIADQPPVNLADGGVIRDGFHPPLDELRHLSRNSRQYIAQIETRERQRTGIASLKVRFNNVFGYYIEISKANLHLAPPDYERKQTLVNAERFITPELKELEAKILAAEEKILDLERELFHQVRSLAALQAPRIRSTAKAVAELDLTAALAAAAVEGNWVRPQFTASGEMRILAGRHPVIEKLGEREGQRFIPNDLELHAGGKFIALITGPNMGGKSTYLRQAALIAILAQMGSFVPAADARLPLLDRIFTRIGASDNLARGRSTFMVEMTETATILHAATPRSLVILDEIGRGTATYDGLALAWAVIEYLHDRVKARTLFATHYHELTELEDRLEGVINLSVSVQESGDQILFLRKVQTGRADRSYGIEVARLAGLPPRVIERAREILAFHEQTEHEATAKLSPRPPARQAPLQIRLFEPLNYQIAARIRQLNLDELRPLEALQILHELQQELQSE